MSIAFLTMVHNEKVFLDLWLRYYKQFSDNLFVINHDSEEDTISRDRKNHKFKEIKVFNNSFHDASWMRDVVKREQKKLLKKFDMVVFVESDEYLLVDPEKYSNLMDFISKNPQNCIFATGYNVVQDLGYEFTLDFAKPILRQRKYWASSTSYSKPVIAHTPLNWVPGFHTIDEITDDHNKPKNPFLILAHLKFADYDEFNNRFRDNGGDFENELRGKILIPERFRDLL